LPIALARVILRLPNAEGPLVPPIVPPKGRWPPSSRCGGTAPGVVEMRLASDFSISSVIASVSGATIVAAATKPQAWNDFR
jgi:hypothetical protein